MTPIFRLGLVIVASAIIAGCSGGGEPEGSAKTEPAADHVFSGQQRAMEKAKGVEQTLNESAAQQQREIDQ